MPRLDRTFSDDDVLRIIKDHLTEEERQNVLQQLTLGAKPSLLEELIEELTNFIPLISTILDIADVLAVFFNRADVEKARQASTFISDRRNALRRALDESIDF